MVLDDPSYSEKNYWDFRFESEHTYEWLAELDSFLPLILSELKPDDRILHIGCGTSRLSHSLFEKGFKKITNVDFSNTLIERENQAWPEMRWICDDIRTLDKIPPETFDFVIEKATIEALLSKEKSQWTLSETGQKDLDSVHQSVNRVLKPGGLFISISFTQPYFRVPHLVKEPYLWDCTVEKFGDSFHFFCYKMRKGHRPDLEALENYLRITR